MAKNYFRRDRLKRLQRLLKNLEGPTGLSRRTLALTGSFAVLASSHILPQKNVKNDYSEDSLGLESLWSPAHHFGGQA